MCLHQIPVFIGMVRSMGRASSDDTNLINYLYPPLLTPKISTPVSIPAPKRTTSPDRSFVNFRPIISRSMSQNLLSVDGSVSPPSLISPSDSHVTSIDFTLKSRSATPDSLGSPTNERATPKKSVGEVYFNKVCSS